MRLRQLTTTLQRTYRLPSKMPPIPPTPIKLAILDDYQSLAPPYFASLPPTISITSHPDTLPSYTHASSTPATREALVTRLKPYTIISSMRERTPFPADLLSQLPNLKLLLTTGTRNAAIDLPACRKLGITVTGAPGTGTNPDIKSAPRKGPDSTTQHTIALILALARHLVPDSNSINSGLWQTRTATGLTGKTFSTVGLGRLGVAVARIMHLAFGMRILAWSTNLTQEAADEKALAAGLPVEVDGEKTFRVVDKETLFRDADVLSVHYVLSPRSIGIVSAPDLALMKPTSLFINTSRGPLVVEDDLLDVLEQGKIRGAAVDVFEIEPLPVGSRWRSTEWGRGGRADVLCTPHMGYVEEEIMGRWYGEQVGVVERWVRGEEVPFALT